jgi:hypothetical protein
MALQIHANSDARTTTPRIAAYAGVQRTVRLVGPPAWIGDGQDVAVLRRTPGHSENGYYIDISRATSQTPSDQTKHTSSPTPDEAEHAPHSPGKRGMWGMFQPPSARTGANFGMR